MATQSDIPLMDLNEAIDAAAKAQYDLQVAQDNCKAAYNAEDAAREKHRVASSELNRTIQAKVLSIAVGMMKP